MDRGDQENKLKFTVRGDWSVLCSQLRASDIHKVGSISGRELFCPFNSWSSVGEGRGILGTVTTGDSHPDPEHK